ncbi:MAG: signal transduction histidine kinase [Firmicutes bacterium]|nr:signal transduction histidine kinase [Bacillota bacterium]
MNGFSSWWAILLPSAMVFVFELVRHSLLERYLPPLAGNLLAALLVSLGAAVYVRVATSNIRRAERRLSNSREETAILQERDRIARSMHDNVSQALFYMGVRLEDVQQQMAQGQLADASALLSEVRMNLNGTYERVRGAIADLRLHPAPNALPEVLRQVTGEVSAQTDLRIVVQGKVPEVFLSVQVAEQLLGIVREALVNTAKHAGVAAATVTVNSTGRGLEVVVSDEGRGFEPLAGTAGFGLLMMRERAGLAGGLLAVDSRPGYGAAVRLEIPLEEVHDATGASSPRR